MRFEAIALLAAAASASAQAVVGTAYGFAKGTTGGGDAAAVTPTSAEELAEYLADDEPRVILIDQEFDFTGTSATGAGCDRKSCSANNGGQLYLGDLSCGGSDNVAVSSITYDAAGPDALPVGSNKSILGVGGKGVLKGKGLSLQKGSSNVIIQGIEFTTINPGVVWGGDALDLQGNNDGVWVDHCKFSSTGRMFIVSHYDPIRLTLSNSELDGTTETSASCNGNHYWTMMFYGPGDQVTLHQNYFHDVSGRAPKLGQDGVDGTFHAVNNYFENMKGHAFDAYDGAQALIEGNAFVSVSQPNTDEAAGVSTFVVNPGSACSSALGRACEENSADSASGELSGGSSTSFISTIADYDTEPMAASEVAAYVKANAGPANLGSASSSGSGSGATEEAVEEEAAPVEEEAPAATTPAAPAATSAAAPVATTPAASEPETPSTGSSGAVAKLYGQCGGQGFSGPTSCESGATCVKSNDWYSQCISSAKFRRSL
ncbi:pectin lyase-like protein [Corynespora cassiicola Philippines]|uniref:pectin lyase n=1 Tax=Corynespora cassiicola Philippines TaxID=1448308 RepID=A0A2T2PCV3_CORCC|nr:pectin lyase-like protein [Corynespora cassiicola Philippines]